MLNLRFVTKEVLKAMYGKDIREFFISQREIKESVKSDVMQSKSWQIEDETSDILHLTLPPGVLGAMLS